MLQLLYLLGKLVEDVLGIRIQGVRRQLVRSGGTANSQVYSARRNGLQDAKLLSNF